MPCISSAEAEWKVLVDTHAHIQWPSFDRDRREVLSRARKAGVERIVTIGFDLEGSREAVRLAGNFTGVYATLGIHPHNASRFNVNILEKLRELSENPKVAAIGEIGLDFYRRLSSRKAQKEAFEAQMSLAEELDLPVIVHNREAHAETLQMLSRFKGRVDGVMHCFSGNREVAQKCMKLNFYISFAGPVTFPDSHKLHETVRSTDLNRIILETDSPWLAPQEKRGKRNEPAFLPFIAKKIAELKDVSVDKIAETTTRNAEKILRLT